MEGDGNAEIDGGMKNMDTEAVTEPDTDGETLGDTATVADEDCDSPMVGDGEGDTAEDAETVGVIRAEHGFHVCGSTIMMIRPSRLTDAAPLPALNGVRARLPM